MKIWKYNLLKKKMCNILIIILKNKNEYNFEIQIVKTDMFEN